jgi:hypothetical protein
MRWVHTVETEKPAVVLPKDIIADTPKKIGGMLSSFWSAFSRSTTPAPERAVTPSIVASASGAERHVSGAKNDEKLLEIIKTQIVLSIFAAEVDVRVDKKMASELLRSTKKNPPAKLKYELIYVRFIFFLAAA